LKRSRENLESKKVKWIEKSCFEKALQSIFEMRTWEKIYYQCCEISFQTYSVVGYELENNQLTLQGRRKASHNKGRSQLKEYRFCSHKSKNFIKHVEKKSISWLKRFLICSPLKFTIIKWNHTQSFQEKIQTLLLKGKLERRLSFLMGLKLSGRKWSLKKKFIILP